MTKGRPLKLLAPKKITKKLIAIYERNATESPLLRLPPELRNMIWEYAFGGTGIHIWSDNERPHPDGKLVRHIYHTVCRAIIDDEKTANTLKTSDKLVSNDFFDRHRRCTLIKSRHQCGPGDLGTNALAACRQIHGEAALLPFLNNTFIFAEMHHLQDFLTKLVPEQARAITSIVLSLPSFASMVSCPTEAKFFENKLTGLKRMVAVKEVSSVLECNYFNHQVALRPLLYQYQPFLLFQSLPIEKVSVAAYVVADSADAWPLGKVVVRAWAAEIERRLVSSDGLTYAERVKGARAVRAA